MLYFANILLYYNAILFCNLYLSLYSFYLQIFTQHKCLHIKNKKDELAQEEQVRQANEVLPSGRVGRAQAKSR